MTLHYHETVKTTISLEKRLIEEIDKHNPFPTRKDFLDQACRAFLKELRRKFIDEKLAEACRNSIAEDSAVNEEWEAVTLEGWK